MLIDGCQLAELIIDFKISVTESSTYEIKRSDSDCFEKSSHERQRLLTNPLQGTRPRCGLSECESSRWRAAPLSGGVRPLRLTRWCG